MEKKKRYCPSCGLKTNEYQCLICGRSTKSLARRFEEEELRILEDDIAAAEDLRVQEETKIEKEKGQKKVKQLYEKYAVHPESIVDVREKIVKNRPKSKKFIRFFVSLIIMVVAMILIPSIIYNVVEDSLDGFHDFLETNEEIDDERSVWENVDFYFDYQSKEDLIDIDTTNKYATLTNKTNMLIECSWEDDWFYLYPYEQRKDYLSSKVEDMEISYVIRYDDVPDTAFELTRYDDQSIVIALANELSEDEYQRIVHTMMAYGLLAGDQEPLVDIKFISESSSQTYASYTIYFDYGNCVRMKDSEVEFIYD